MRNPGSISQLPPSLGGAHRQGQVEPVVVVGRICVGDFCHVPVTVEGMPCSALVDTGSTVTLVRPDIVPGWTQFEPTTVQRRTVTGELAPMKGKGIMTLTVEGRTVHHPVWVVAVQNQSSIKCIYKYFFTSAYVKQQAMQM